MADFSDIKKICEELDVQYFVWRANDSSMLAAVDRKFIISQDWIDSDHPDDLFEILVKVGEASSPEGDKDIEYAVWYAVTEAKELGIRISRDKADSVSKRLPSNSSVHNDLESIALEHKLKYLVDQYGLPLKVRMPRFYGDFYFLAEKIDERRHAIDGSQFRGGTFYRSKSYDYSEICSLIDNPTETPIVEPKQARNEDREYNNKIRERIKGKDTFDEVQSNHADLLNHQKAGLLLASRYDKFAFFYDTGTGKTVMTLSIIKAKQEAGARFLILAPKAIIKSAWCEDMASFFPELRILPISNNFYFDDYAKLYRQWERTTQISAEDVVSEKTWALATMEIDYSQPDWSEQYDARQAARNYIYACLATMAEHYIVNIEKFRYDPDSIMDYYDINGLIVDESAILKNPNSVSAKTLFEHADQFSYIYLLSGKPAPNNSSEYYAQMKLVDPNTFHMSFNAFKSRYFTGSGSKMAPISPKAEEDVANMVANRSLIVSKDDCLSLPDIFQEIRTVRLPKDIMEQYNRLFEFCIFSLQAKEKQRKGAYYSAVCKLAVFTKLREVASGFLIDDYGATVDLHSEKITALRQIVEEKPDEQMVIWCQFEHEIKEVEKTLSQYGTVETAYGKTKNIDESIRRFKNGEAKYIVAHPKSIKYGVTFTKCCTAIYYSMSYSAEDYYQSRDRIHRLGQSRICTYYFIQAENTIDEVMYEAVEKKMSYAEVFAVIVKQAAKHGIDYNSFKDEEPQVVDELISTQAVKNKFAFEIVDEIQFTYTISKKIREGIFYNTMLPTQSVLRPEELLFEIGYANWKENHEAEAEKAKKDYVVSYLDVIEVSKWVLSEMKELNIRRIQRVYDYLEEQIHKQYEYDVANGASKLNSLDVLSLRYSEPTQSVHKDSLESKTQRKKRSFFGDLGRPKKVSQALKEIRDEVMQIFFDSGKYRLTHKCFCGDESVAHCHLELGLVFQSKEDFENLTPENLFDLLHEVGHLETNTVGMTRQEEEFFATEWALQRMKLYDFHLPRARQKQFDDYINGYSSRRNKVLGKDGAPRLNWEE